jgi:hypothetical protein
MHSASSPNFILSLIPPEGDIILERPSPRGTFFVIARVGRPSSSPWQRPPKRLAPCAKCFWALSFFLTGERSIGYKRVYLYKHCINILSRDVEYKRF